MALEYLVIYSTSPLGDAPCTAAKVVKRGEPWRNGP
jgi:hypothetical protein